MLRKFKYIGLKCDIKYSLCGQTYMEYLGLLVTWNGIHSINKNVDAIVKMMPPKKIFRFGAFIGLLNYYRGMWEGRSHLLQTLTTLMAYRLMFKYTDV